MDPANLNMSQNYDFNPFSNSFEETSSSETSSSDSNDNLPDQTKELTGRTKHLGQELETPESYSIAKTLVVIGLLSLTIASGGKTIGSWLNKKFSFTCEPTFSFPQVIENCISTKVPLSLHDCFELYSCDGQLDRNTSSHSQMCCVSDVLSERFYSCLAESSKFGYSGTSDLNRKVFSGTVAETTNVLDESNWKFDLGILLQKPQHYMTEMLSSSYENAYALIKKELRLAQAEEKKLLIIVGETHNNLDCLLSKLLIAFAAHHLGIRDVLSESADFSQREQVINTPLKLSDNYYNHRVLDPILLKMGSRFYSVDPKQNEYDEFNTFKNEFRNKAMNRAVFNLDFNSHAMFFCGISHLKHLINCHLQNKYRLLPINVVPKCDPIPMANDGTTWIESHSYSFTTCMDFDDLYHVFTMLSQLPAIQHNEQLVRMLQTIGSSKGSSISFNAHITEI